MKKRTPHAYRRIVDLYCKLGSLRRVANQLSITQEGVRQALLRGHKLGVIRYTPRIKSCKAIENLTEVLKDARVHTLRDLQLRLGFVSSRSLEMLCSRLGVTSDIIRQRLLENKKQCLLEEARTLLRSVPDLCVTEIQQGNKALYNRLIYAFGDIATVRSLLGLSYFVYDSTRSKHHTNYYKDSPNIRR